MIKKADADEILHLANLLALARVRRYAYLNSPNMSADTLGGVRRLTDQAKADLEKYLEERTEK